MKPPATTRTAGRARPLARYPLSDVVWVVRMLLPRTRSPERRAAMVRWLRERGVEPD
jgi:hypothetical protein